MSKEQVYRGMWITGLGLVVMGASLYAANSPNRTLTQGTVVIGLTVLIAYGALNRRLVITLFRKRSTRYGVNTMVTTAAFVSIVVVVQALSARHSLRYDFTRNKRFSPAQQTVTVLDNLRKDVVAYAFFRRGTPDEAQARDLLEQFRHRTVRFGFELIDPDQRPQKARDMDVFAYGTTVVAAGARRETLARLSEESLLNAVVKVSKDTVKTVCFVKGHGERELSNDDRDGYLIAVEAMEREGFEVRSISLFDVASIPDECALLVVAGPRKDYLESEIGKIEERLGRGGRAVFLVDPHTDLPNVETLLERYRIRVNDDAIVDPFSRVFGGDYSVPVVTEYEDHAITRDFKVATFFPTARSVAIIDPGIEGVTAQYLARTGKSAWGETDLELIDKGQAVKSEKDNVGPVPVAVLAQKKFPTTGTEGDEKIESTIVVFGDSDFAANSSFRLSGNSDLFLNVVNYLAEERDLVAIRPKEGPGDRLFLTASQGRFIFLFSVVLLPLAVIGFGTTVWVRRRRRG